MSNIKTAVETTKVSARDVAIVAMKAAMPFKAEIGTRAFRGLILAQLRTIQPYTSVPMNYNYAMDTLIAEKFCKPFGKKHGFPIGPKVELTQAQIDAVNNAMKSAIAIATGQEDVSLLEGMTWKVIDKKTKDTVHYAATRKQAYELRDGNAELSCKAIK